MPKLINGFIERKQRYVDWIKLFAIGIPFLYLSSALPLMYLDIPIIASTFFAFNSGGNITGITIAGVIVGYVIEDSMKEK